MVSLAQGFSYNLRGVKYFWAHRSLWKFALIPVMINIFIFAGFLALSFHYTGDLMGLLLKPLAAFLDVSGDGFLQALLAGIFWVIRQIIRLLVFLLTLVLICLLAYMAGSLINAPFYEMLAEQVLVLHGARADRSFSWKEFFTLLRDGLKFEFFKIIFFGGLTLALTVLSWLPGVGVVFLVLQFILLAWLFAFGICTYPMLLEQVSFQDMLKWGGRRKLRLVGFGLFSLIPLVGLLAMPFQVVGGTLLYLEQL